ncbi:CPSF A subunit region-domain-containing protein [Thamnidium elegans]|nr:CPSF A subunit region-domain-containing protein [Thamnidium elegans]
MSKHHVVTTLNPATAVTCATKGCFVNASVENLIICIFGVISSIQMCNLFDQQTSSIFLLTEQNCFTVLSFDAKRDSIITEGHGMIETNARNTDQPIATILDRKTNTILVSAFTGFLFAIPMSKGNGKTKNSDNRFSPSAMRTREYDILSIVSLRGIHVSAMAVLSGETNELKTIKTFKYKHGTNEVAEMPKLTVKVEATTHTLISVPDPIGGVLAIGEYIISYHDLTLSPGSTKELSIDLVTVTAHTFLKNSVQCILGDAEGYLYVLTLETTNMKVVGITSNVIGQSSIPHTIIDLGNGLLYIGSTQGDSSIIRLVPNALRKYTVEPVSTFLNLGPIVDFCLFDYDGHGEQTMICCSGTDKEGSLRIVENGVGFVEKFQLNIPLLNKVWSLGTNTLVITTALETIVLKAARNNPSELTEYQNYSELVLDQDTLDIAFTLNKRNIVQVTTNSVRLVQDDEKGLLVAEWIPPNNQKISIAKVNTRQCVVCCGKGTLVYLDITDNALSPKCVKQFPDIACIHLSPKHENGTGHDFVTIGMWSQSMIKILQLPGLNPVLEHTLDSVTGPKDVLMITLEKIPYLMVLLGDGQILTSRIAFKNSKAVLSDSRQTMVGTYCTAMYPFEHGGEQKIFITGIRPTIVTSWHRKLFFSAVNLKIKLNDEMPIRIQYSTATKLLSVGTIQNQKDINNGFIKHIGKIQILDAQTFHGRILVFDIKERKCELLEQVKLPGVIYSLKSFQNSVVACVNGSIFCLQKFQPDLPLGERVEFKSEIHNNTVALSLDTNGDRVLVADLMQSVSVLTMSNKDPLSLKLLAVDSQPAWMTAVKFVNENVYIGADNKNNVFTLSLNPSRQLPQRVNQSGIMRLELEGGYHIGSHINCFKQDILSDMLSNAPATQHNENDITSQITATESSFTYVTVHGSIGTIKTISENSFHFFKQIQSSILKESGNIGGLDHTAWRSYKSRIHSTEESNYLDGDLLKSFQQMNAFSKQRVIESLPSSIYKASDIENFIRTLVA